MNIIRSIINFFGAEDIVDGIGERGMRDSSIIKYNEIHDMYVDILPSLKQMGFLDTCQLTCPRAISMIR